MSNIDVLPAEILADIFGHEDLGILSYLKSLPLDDRLSIRALDLSPGRQHDSVSVSAYFEEVADQDCVRNVLLIQSLLGSRIIDLTINDTGWAPDSLVDISQMALLTTHHLACFQISLLAVESCVMPELMNSILELFRRDASHLKFLVLDLAQSLDTDHWETMADCTELQSFHLGLHRSSEPILTSILETVLPKWSSLTSLYICQPRFVSAETLRCLHRDLPRPDRLRELHLIFEACQASLYEQEFIEMVHAMPNLQILEAHLDWTNRMMEHVAITLSDLRELSITCSGLDFTCRGIVDVAWGQGLEKVNMRTSGKIWSGFLEAVRKRSRRVKILVYGSMKWGGSVDEWE
ncbi:hypothetical protein BGZ54_006567 [Gamsiella multidivaricata]|nr:hypothetical protein BGZ54_006567 [Gamsiella multidivaricata]